MAARLLLFILFPAVLFAQEPAPPPYYNEFQAAYAEYPNIPRGFLEAVAFTNTHIRHITHDNEVESCTGMPFRYGVMGWVEDGKGVFQENLPMAVNWGYNAEEIKDNPSKNILAYAHLLSLNIRYPHGVNMDTEYYLPQLLNISEFPIYTDDTTGEEVRDFAMNSWLYSICLFLNDPAQEALYNFPDHHLDIRQIFGDNYDILSAAFVTVSPNQISANGHQWQRSRMAVDYPGAIWNAAASCNYSSRSGVAVSAVTVHTVQGTYAGCISWFQNCSAQVSAHYVVRSVDGQVTQMVSEADKAWHVGSENPYTIGIEHEGYVNDPSWYTPAMYQGSANLVKDICNSGYGINPLSCYKGSLQTVLNTCYRIKGHSHYPNQTHNDPGVNWNWPYYYSLINSTISGNTLTACSGTLYDNGGSGGNYVDLSKYTTTIQPAGALSVTMNFSSFSLEQGYDSLYIYDGPSINSPLIGGYTGTTSPGTITANSGKITLLFTSDCSINSWGYAATWACTTCPGTLAVTTTSTPVACNGGANGAATANVSGGTTPYQYLWQGGGTSATKSNLSAGSYTVTVTDANGCSLSSTTTVTQPQPLAIALTGVNPQCNGSADGSISTAVTGGTSPYAYLWPDNITTSGLSAIPAGIYSVVVTDAHGCTKATADTLSAPASISITFSTDDVSCHGGSDGGIRALITGGTGLYTYAWSNAGQLDSISALSAGAYALTVTDANGCAATNFDTVTEPPVLTANFVLTQPVCSGSANNGAITANVSGGIPPYSLVWSNVDTGTILSGLPAGSYAVNITDGNGCILTDTATLVSPANMLVGIDMQIPVVCYGLSIAKLSVSVNGGASPYTYLWSTGDIIDTAASLPAGLYTVTVTDANGCASMGSYTLAQPPEFFMSLSVTDVSCHGGNNGQVAAIFSGGSPPYHVLWSNYVYTEVNYKLSAGFYFAHVYDNNGCVNTLVAEVKQPPALIVDTVMISGNEAIITGISGGVPPYSINWCTGDTGMSATLATGVCDVVITDSNGCTEVRNLTIMPTSVQQLEVPATLVVTNPAHNICHLHLTLPSEEKLTIQLIDIQGRILQEHMVTTAALDYELNTSPYARGMYLVQVLSEKHSLSRKVVLE
jgi:N-acetyl-anhydromuramyl-L-alanine amidase AmpD